MKSFFVLTSLLLSLLIPPVFAQIRVDRFNNIGVEQGLSSYRMYDMVQDPMGYLWIATMDGLDRYDGYTFTVFKHDDHDSTSLSDNLVASLCIDKSGDVWAVTSGATLHRFLKSRQKFERFRLNLSSDQGNDVNSIRSIYQDMNGFLWASTAKLGLWQIRVPSGEYSSGGARELTCIRHVHDPLEPGSLASNRILSVLMDHAGVLWVGTDQGLDALEPGAQHFKHYRHTSKDPISISDNEVSSLLEDKSGVLWIGTANGILDAMDKTRSRVRPYRLSGNGMATLTEPIVTLGEQDSSHLWVGTHAGVFRLDRITGQSSRLVHDPLDPNSLADDYIMKILEDRSGNTWFVTDRGLSKLIKRTAEFVHYRHEPNRSLPQSVTAILNDANDVLWVGTENGIKTFDSKSHHKAYYQPGTSRGNLHGDYVQSIFQDREGNVWVGTGEGGLNKYRTDGSFDYFTWLPTKKVYTVMSICEDSSGKLWIGTLGEGLLRFDPQRKGFDQFKNDPAISGSLSHNVVPAVLADRLNRLWIGTEGGGLNILDLNSLQGSSANFVHLRHDPLDARSISNDRIHALGEDHDGGLWISTDYGLDLYDQQKDSLVHVLRNGQSFEGLILGIVEDDHANLWLSTMQNGLYRFDPVRKGLEEYDVDDGLQSNKFYYASSRSKTGEIILGGEDGFNVFHPDKIGKNSCEPRVVLTEFRIFNEPVRTTFSAEVKLNYDQNYFSFEFAALDLTMPWKNEYMYMLEGFDKTWVHSGRRRMAAYTNIDPGHYIFRVRGSNNDGTWGREELTIPVTIRPPIWATWWFRSLVVLTVLAVARALYRYRVSKLLEIERMRVRIASDLHDDIGSSLGSIALTSDVIQSYSELPSAERKQLAEISTAARKTAETLRDIVWVITPECDTAQSLVLKLKDEASSMLHRIEHSFEFTEREQTIILDMDLRHSIILIFKEALHNIVKHSQATFVEIEADVGPDELHLNICDNGQGFDFTHSHKGNGLKNMKRRGEKLGALVIESGENGTKIHLTAKIP